MITFLWENNGVYYGLNGRSWNEAPGVNDVVELQTYAQQFINNQFGYRDAFNSNVASHIGIDPSVTPNAYLAYYNADDSCLPDIVCVTATIDEDASGIPHVTSDIVTLSSGGRQLRFTFYNVAPDCSECGGGGSASVDIYKGIRYAYSSSFVGGYPQTMYEQPGDRDRIGICFNDNEDAVLNRPEAYVWLPSFIFDGSSVEPEDGVSSFVSFVFTRATLKPATPTGGSFDNPMPNEAIWSDTVEGEDDTLAIWMSKRVFWSDNRATENWTEPKCMSDSKIFQSEWAGTDGEQAYLHPELLPNLNLYKIPTTFENPEGIDEPRWREDALSLGLGDWSDDANDAVYMAWCNCIRGEWGDWTVAKIKGEKGEDGNGGRTFMIFTAMPSDSYTPNRPSGGTWNRTTNKLSGVTGTASDGSGHTVTAVWSTDNMGGGGSISWVSTGNFDSEGNLTGQWSVPARITGENGRDGEDGENLEFIYALCKDLNTFSAYTNSSEYWALQDKTTPGKEGKTYNDSDYVPYFIQPFENMDEWYDNPQGIRLADESRGVTERRVEICCTRRKNRETGDWEAGDGTSGAWSAPIIWACWGEDGIDGDGVEYIFAITQTLDRTFNHPQLGVIDISETLPKRDDVLWSGTSSEARLEEHWDEPEIWDFIRSNRYNEQEATVAYRPWTDDPTDTTPEKPYEWVSIRRSKHTKIKYKGTKNTYSNLPSNTNNTGDVWKVTSAVSSSETANHKSYPAGTKFVWVWGSWNAYYGPTENVDNKYQVIWGDFEDPSLWSRWADDGESIFTVFAFTTRIAGEDISNYTVSGITEGQGGYFDILPSETYDGTGTLIPDFEWQDGPSADDPGDIIWMVSATFSEKYYSDGFPESHREIKIVSDWTHPQRMEDTENFEVMYTWKEEYIPLPTGFTKTGVSIDGDWLDSARTAFWYDEVDQIPPGYNAIWMATIQGQNNVFNDSDWNYIKVKGEHGETVTKAFAFTIREIGDDISNLRAFGGDPSNINVPLVPTITGSGATPSTGATPTTGTTVNIVWEDAPNISNPIYSGINEPIVWMVTALFRQKRDEEQYNKINWNQIGTQYGKNGGDEIIAWSEPTMMVDTENFEVMYSFSDFRDEADARSHMPSGFTKNGININTTWLRRATAATWYDEVQDIPDKQIPVWKAEIQGINNKFKDEDWQFTKIKGENADVVFTSFAYTVLENGVDISDCTVTGTKSSSDNTGETGVYYDVVPTTTKRGTTDLSNTIRWSDTPIVPSGLGEPIVWEVSAAFKRKLKEGYDGSESNHYTFVLVSGWSKPTRKVDTENYEVLYSYTDWETENNAKASIPSGFTKNGVNIDTAWLRRATAATWYDEVQDIPAGKIAVWKAEIKGKNNKFSDADWECYLIKGENADTVFTSFAFAVTENNVELSGCTVSGYTASTAGSDLILVPTTTKSGSTTINIAWKDTPVVPSGVKVPIVWMVQATFDKKLKEGCDGTGGNSDYDFEMISPWGKPQRMVDTEDFEVMYSPTQFTSDTQAKNAIPSGFTKVGVDIQSSWLNRATAATWYDEVTDFTAETIWMATITGHNNKFNDTDWQVHKVKGEDGEGKVKSMVFCRSNTTPTRPAATMGSFDSPNPPSSGWTTGGTKWYDSIPSGDAIAWMSTRMFSSKPGRSDANWSAPAQCTDSEFMDYEWTNYTGYTSTTQIINSNKLPLKQDPDDNLTPANNNQWYDDPITDAVFMAVRPVENGAYKANSTWTVSKIKGEDGKDGQPGASGATGPSGDSTLEAFVFARTNNSGGPARPSGGTYTNPTQNLTPTGVWNDTVPGGNLRLWMSTRTFSTNSSKQDANWSTPVQCTDSEFIDYEWTNYSGYTGLDASAVTAPSKSTPDQTVTPSTNNNWSDEPIVGAEFMAVRTVNNGQYVGQWKVSKIKGEAGEGKVKSLIFCRAASKPTVPANSVGSFTNPTPGNSGWNTNAGSGTIGAVWYDTIPSGSSAAWMSSRLFSSVAGESDASWTPAVQCTDSEYLDYEWTNYSGYTTLAQATAHTPTKSTPQQTVTPQNNNWWYDEPITGAVFMAVREVKNGAYVGSWKVSQVKGEAGEVADLDYLKNIFDEVDSKPFEATLRGFLGVMGNDTNVTAFMNGNNDITHPDDSANTLMIAAGVPSLNNANDAAFRVYKDGHIYATNADINGGTIGGLSINDGSISAAGSGDTFFSISKDGEISIKNKNVIIDNNGITFMDGGLPVLSVFNHIYRSIGEFVGSMTGGTVNITSAASRTVSTGQTQVTSSGHQRAFLVSDEIPGYYFADLLGSTFQIYGKQKVTVTMNLKITGGANNISYSNTYIRSDLYIGLLAYTGSTMYYDYTNFYSLTSIGMSSTGVQATELVIVRSSETYSKIIDGGTQSNPLNVRLVALGTAMGEYQMTGGYFEALVQNGDFDNNSFIYSNLVVDNLNVKSSNITVGTEIFKNGFGVKESDQNYFFIASPVGDGGDPTSLLLSMRSGNRGFDVSGGTWTWKGGMTPTNG